MILGHFRGSGKESWDSILTSRTDESTAARLFGKRLQAEMYRRQISHRQLATAISVSKQSVTNWTQGRHEPSPHSIRRIAEVLEIPVAELLEPSPPGDTRRKMDAAEVLSALSSLRPALEGLSQSAPALLDLLDEAERQARSTRRHG
jgi:transcriptional regulator with XRE-family HTH domain